MSTVAMVWWAVAAASIVGATVALLATYNAAARGS
jgi:hypothetical protein